MLIDDKISIIINSNKQLNYYRRLNYECNINDTILVNIIDLPKGSKVEIKLYCDYCLEEGKYTVINRKYYNHINQNKKNIIKKDCCVSCKGKMIKESNMIKYKVDSVAKLEENKIKVKETNMNKYGGVAPSCSEEVRNKMKKTTKDRYGVEHAMHIQETKDKIKQTNLDRYGSEYYTQTDEYKERVKITNNDKYGCDNIFQNPIIQEKQKSTIRMKYGCDNVFQNDNIKIKIKNTIINKYGVSHVMKNITIKNKVIAKGRYTMYKNGTAPKSKQQIYLHNLLGGIINYPQDRLMLDIAFPDEKIYIEYNGGGHDLQVKLGKLSEKQFKTIEIKRYMYLKSEGWKQILINSPRDYLPLDEIIIDEINKAKEILINTNLNHYNIILSNNSYDDKYGKLRLINN